MSDDEERREESERPRPRIVDKRVSARSTESAAAPPQESSPPPSAPPAQETSPPPPDPVGAEAPEQPGRPEAPGPSGAVPEPGEAETAGERVWTPEEEAQAQQMARELAERPSEEWVLNIAVTLANVAGAKIQFGVPEDARLAIDALEAIVNAVAARIEGAETPLRQTLAQLQLAYAQTVQTPPSPTE